LISTVIAIAIGDPDCSGARGRRPLAARSGARTFRFRGGPLRGADLGKRRWAVERVPPMAHQHPTHRPEGPKRESRADMRYCGSAGGRQRNVARAGGMDCKLAPTRAQGGGRHFGTARGRSRRQAVAGAGRPAHRHDPRDGRRCDSTGDRCVPSARLYVFCRRIKSECGPFACRRRLRPAEALESKEGARRTLRRREIGFC